MLHCYVFDVKFTDFQPLRVNEQCVLFCYLHQNINLFVSSRAFVKTTDHTSVTFSVNFFSEAEVSCNP